MALQKVVCCIVNPLSDSILIFHHPYAGYQFPKGTVEIDESLENACIRECFEETGLDPSSKPIFLFKESHPANNKDLWIIDKTKCFSRPNESSFDWITINRGLHVHQIDEHNNFFQIEYKEYDNEENPQKVSFSFCGWIPKINTSFELEYYFYKFSEINDRNSWNHFMDNHNVNLEWHNKNKLPIMYGIQEKWKKRLIENI